MHSRRRCFTNAGLVVSVLIALLLPGSGPPRVAPTERRAGLFPRGIVAMDFAENDLHARRSLELHGREFTHLLPSWFHLGAEGEPLRGAVVAKTRADAAYLGLTIIPTLDDTDRGTVDPEAIRALLADSARRGEVIGDLAAALDEADLGGVNVQFAGLGTANTPALATFLRELRAALAPDGRIVIASVPAGGQDPQTPATLTTLLPHADYLRPLLYGQHGPDTAPGPSAPLAFFGAALDLVARAVPPDKLIIGTSMIGHDWGADGAVGEIDFARAMALATTHRGTVTWEPQAGGLVLAYTAAGVAHRAYLEDALTLGSKLRPVAARHPAGVSFDRLGREDPALWPLLAGDGSPSALADLADIPPTLPFQIVGAGEIWDVAEADRRPGRREFALDPATGQVADLRYVALPTPHVLQRSGVPAGGKRIALTFDDGPSAEWTPAILDTLSRHQVPATFFMVGRHALQHRPLVRRVYAEGHEIGSHTFTHTALGEMAPTRAALELNATRYVIAGITGRNMRFVRSPFVANPDPRDEAPSMVPNDFLLPLLHARQHGYLTAGSGVDPQDWARPGAPQIVTTATDRGQETPGHIILLHDSGGDRRQTLEALPAIIETYRAQGYQFTTLSGLLGHDRQFGMPPVRPEERNAVRFMAASFTALHIGETVLSWLLYLGVVGGLLRAASMLLLAWIHYRRPRPRPFTDREIQPFVSILVPAYNEEKVVGATITSLLRSDYRNYEIVVIDDGSRDGTLATARRYAVHPQVRVITKRNGGKSSALNLGISLARGEVIIAMDADTVFDPAFIPHILGHFRDPAVGAVSGNAKVGNRRGRIAGWQSIEYITGFNLDRRAYTLLNCVMVVPGAAGAWRRRDLLAAGGFGYDTLAEDADLTVSVRRLGRRIVYEDRALAWTEAPDTVAAFIKQRRRWSYGTLQVLWKHRAALLRRRDGALGLVAFPSTLLYLGLSLIGPAVDLGAIWFVLAQLAELGHLNREGPIGPRTVLGALFWTGGATPLLYYTAFLALELVQSAVAFRVDRESLRPLAWVPVQRIAMRWLLYFALFATFVTALRGLRVGWGKLERTGAALGGQRTP